MADTRKYLPTQQLGQLSLPPHSTYVYVVYIFSFPYQTRFFIFLGFQIGFFNFRFVFSLGNSLLVKNGMIFFVEIIILCDHLINTSCIRVLLSLPFCHRRWFPVDARISLYALTELIILERNVILNTEVI